MAVCEIWDVRGRLDHPIDYAENPEKTANPNYSETDLQALVDVMNMRPIRIRRSSVFLSRVSTVILLLPERK